MNFVPFHLDVALWIILFMHMTFRWMFNDKILALMVEGLFLIGFGYIDVLHIILPVLAGYEILSRYFDIPNWYFERQNLKYKAPHQVALVKFAIDLSLRLWVNLSLAIVIPFIR